jgi:hypothetical protein
MTTLAVLATIFAVAGAICELLGLVMVALEIRSDRIRGERFLERLDQPQRPERRYPSPVMASAMPRREYLDPLYPQSQHVRGVVKELEESYAAIANGFLNLRKTVDADLDAAIDAVQRDIAERDALLRDGLRYVLAGSTRQRWRGVQLLATGIALTAVSAVLVSNATTARAPMATPSVGKRTAAEPRGPVNWPRTLSAGPIPTLSTGRNAAL